MARITLPDGNYEMVGNQGSFLVTRSRQDIPISVTCNGKTRAGIVPTYFDMLLGGIGNFIFGGIIGWIIDGTGNKAYDSKSPYNLAPLCEPLVSIPQIN